MPQNYWLLKTEPSTYSFDQLIREGRTNWNDVRNYQARNYLKTFAPGDLAVIYHSGEDKAVVGLAKVIKGPYPDGEWVQVDLEAQEKLQRPVPLVEIKAHKSLVDLPMLKQSRLSVMPITSVHYDTLLRLGGKS